MSGYIDYQGATPDFPAFEGLDYDQWLEDNPELILDRITEWGGDNVTNELIMDVLYAKEQSERNLGKKNLEVIALGQTLIDAFVREDPNGVLAEGYKDYCATYEPRRPGEDY